jgi:hypothetical protein
MTCISRHQLAFFVFVSGGLCAPGDVSLAVLLHGQHALISLRVCWCWCGVCLVLVWCVFGVGECVSVMNVVHRKSAQGGNLLCWFVQRSQKRCAPHYCIRSVPHTCSVAVLGRALAAATASDDLRAGSLVVCRRFYGPLLGAICPPPLMHAAVWVYPTAQHRGVMHWCTVVTRAPTRLCFAVILSVVLAVCCANVSLSQRCMASALWCRAVLTVSLYAVVLVLRSSCAVLRACTGWPVVERLCAGLCCR